jgi:hypothetical protein
MRTATGLEALKELSASGLLITVGNQGDGGVYGLYPTSRLRIEESFPETKQLRSVKLGQYRASDFDSLQPPRWEAVIPLLTGLSREQIVQLGGVTMYDTDNDRVLFQWPPEAFKG